jgi:hypothetical protein
MGMAGAWSLQTGRREGFPQSSSCQADRHHPKTVRRRFFWRIHWR